MIEKIDIQLDGSDPFGRLSDGLLCINGGLKPFLISGPVPPAEHSEHATFYGRTPQEPSLALLDGKIMATATMNTDCGPQTVMGLLLSYRFYEGRVSEAYVLLLRETSLRDGEFRRVGISSVSAVGKRIFHLSSRDVGLPVQLLLYRYAASGNLVLRDFALAGVNRFRNSVLSPSDNY
jgi:hypothetical protein